MARILIIEDEKAMSDLITIKFKVEGFEVDQAFNLAEAKQKLLAGGYDAVLSDYLLPDGNALDMIGEVRADPKVANVPIVMATNYIEDLSKDKAAELKIAEVIVKYQVVPAQMVQKIKALLGQSAGQTTDHGLPTTAVDSSQLTVDQNTNPSAVVPQAAAAPVTDPTQGALPPGAAPAAPQPAPTSTPEAAPDPNKPQGS